MRMRFNDELLTTINNYWCHNINTFGLKIICFDGRRCLGSTWKRWGFARTGTSRWRTTSSRNCRRSTKSWTFLPRRRTKSSKRSETSAWIRGSTTSPRRSSPRQETESRFAGWLLMNFHLVIFFCKLFCYEFVCQSIDCVSNCLLSCNSFIQIHQAEPFLPTNVHFLMEIILMPLI